MNELEDKINPGIFVVNDNNQDRKSWSCLGQPCSTSLTVFLSQRFVNLLIIFHCLWRIHLSESCVESTARDGIFCSAAEYILPLTGLWTGYFCSTKNRVFLSLVVPSETGKSQVIYNWLKNGLFHTKFDKTYFLSTFSTSLRCYAKGNW